MEDINLTNKPLVEALFELRWHLEEPQPGFFVDPYYQMLIGKYYGQVEEKFPFWEKLPQADMPDSIIPHLPGHRFRKGDGQWPLVQLGPGLLTVNDTEGYSWNSFSEHCSDALQALWFSYEKSGKKLSVKQVVLRYIDADYLENETVRDFLANNLKITLNVPDSLFQSKKVKENTAGLAIHMIFPSDTPQGHIQVKFSQGQKSGKDALIWETIVDVQGETTPKTIEEIQAWLLEAHNLTHEWFFALISGPLLEKYK